MAMPTNTKDIVMSPLADPVVSAIFADKETAGLAAESLIKAVLETDGVTFKPNRIISVTPQRHHGGATNERGCRVDVEIATTDNERVIVEVQTNPEHWIIQRNLFAASRIYTETSNLGDTDRKMANRLPKMIFINILTYNIRDDNKSVIQPTKVMFTQAPQRVAVSNFTVYNVQLPRIGETEAKFDAAWYCWFYLMHKADTEQKTIGEVMAMTPQLQAYSERDAGFRQYCARYNRVATDPDARHEYLLWVEELMRQEGIKQAAMDKGISIGEARGRAEGEARGISIGEARGISIGATKATIEMAKALKQEGLSIEQIARITKLTVVEVESI
jgi:predicted transposase/invertase (TIGR01784 family)